MRILLVSDYVNDPRLGSPKVAIKLREQYRALGHDCDALFREELGLRPRNERLRQLVSPWLAWRATARQWRKHGPYDVIDAASAEGMMIGVARNLGGFRGATLIVRSNGLEHLNYRRLVEDHYAGLIRKPWIRRVWHPLVRLTQVAQAARLADRMIVLNPEGRGFAIGRSWQPLERLDVIPHGVDARFLESAPGPEARGAGALFVGSWTSAKGIHYLAEAHRRLAETGAGMMLTVIGAGMDESVVRSDFAPISQPWLQVLPRLQEEELFAQYRRHDFLVCPSTMEGFGLVAIEALSQRLPIIISSAAGAASLLQDGVNALVVRPRDVTGLVQAMQRLAGDAALREQLGESGWRRVRFLTWRRTADQTLLAYHLARKHAELPRMAARRESA